jgi:hypothetical protein
VPALVSLLLLVTGNGGDAPAGRVLRASPGRGNRRDRTIKATILTEIEFVCIDLSRYESRVHMHGMKDCLMNGVNSGEFVLHQMAFNPSLLPHLDCPESILSTLAIIFSSSRPTRRPSTNSTRGTIVPGLR